jgi:uncharacterized protein (DUF1778 family)
MRDELKAYSPEELEQAALEARADRAHYWDERFRDESDALADLKPAKVKVAKKLGARATVGLRLAAEELALIEETARARGVTFSEFVRDAALAAASGAISWETEDKARLITEMRLSLRAFEASLERVELNRELAMESPVVPEASVMKSRSAATGRYVLATPRTQKAGKTADGSALTQRSKSARKKQAQDRTPKGEARRSR